MIVNAKNLILGRFATMVAKKALLGEKVQVINCEKAIISGIKKSTFDKYKKRANRGSHAKGPFIPKLPERLVKRTIRNMLPYKKPHGRAALKRVLCYRGIPDTIKDQKIKTIKSADFSKLSTLNYTTVGAVCKHLGGKE